MRKVTREKTMKLLYSMDVYRQIAKYRTLQDFMKTEDAIELFEQQKKFLLHSKDDETYLDETFYGVVEHIVAIDQKINEYTKKSWTIAQFGYVERSLLRIAVYELYWSNQEGLHPNVIVASIISMSEVFVDPKSTNFIQGILSAMTNNKQVEVAPIATNRSDSAYKKQDSEQAKKNKAALQAFKANKRKLKSEQATTETKEEQKSQ